MSDERLIVRLAARAGALALDVDAAFALDRVTALFGPSGAGKSLLLRLIAGLDRPQAGRVVLGDDVWFDSQTGRSLPAWRRPVGFMFQDARLFPHLDVAGNLAYAERRSRDSAQEPAFDDVVDALDLGALLTRRTASLSGGERQRVALGRTLLARPRLLLLDEPLSALDRPRKAGILPYLETAVRAFGLPVVYVSHDLEEVAALADDIAVIEAGRIAAHGPAAAVLERIDLPPLGGRGEGIALLQGTVRAQDRALCLTLVDVAGETFSTPLRAAHEPGDPVRLRVRARDVVIALGRPRDLSIRNCLPAKIETMQAEDRGAFADLVLQTGAGRLKARITRASAADLGLRIGQSVCALVKSVTLEAPDPTSRLLADGTRRRTDRDGDA